MNILQLLNEEEPVIKNGNMQVTKIKVHYKNIIELLIQKNAQKIEFGIEKISVSEKRKELSASTIVKITNALLEERGDPLDDEIVSKVLVFFKERAKGLSPVEMRKLKNEFTRDLRTGKGLVEEFVEKYSSELIKKVNARIKHAVNNYSGKWFEEVVWEQLKNRDKEPVKGLFDLMIDILGEDFFSQTIEINKSLDDKAAFDIEISFNRKAIITISCKFRPSEFERKREVGFGEGKVRGYSLGNQSKVHFGPKDAARVKQSIKEFGLNPDDYIKERDKKVSGQNRRTKVYYTNVFQVLKDAYTKGKETILNNKEEALFLTRAGGRWMITAKVFSAGDAKIKTLRPDHIKDVKIDDNGNIIFLKEKGQRIIEISPKDGKIF